MGSHSLMWIKYANAFHSLRLKLLFKVDFFFLFYFLSFSWFFGHEQTSHKLDQTVFGVTGQCAGNRGSHLAGGGGDVWPSACHTGQKSKFTPSLKKKKNLFCFVAFLNCNNTIRGGQELLRLFLSERHHRVRRKAAALLQFVSKFNLCFGKI